MKKKLKRLLVLAVATAMFASSMLGVSASGLRDVFDAKYYADTYKDLKAAFGDDEEALYQHFINSGLKENRKMSPVIDVQAYRAAYPDLEAAFGDDWDAYVEHFFMFGAKENRTGGVLFNPLKYAEAYPDVAAAFGSDLRAITNHFLTCGIKEGRTAGVVAKEETSSSGVQAKQPTADEIAVAAAKKIVLEMPIELVVTADQEAEDVITAIGTAISNEDIEDIDVTWNDVPPAADNGLVAVNSDTNGSITGTVVLTKGSATEKVTINWILLSAKENTAKGELQTAKTTLDNYVKNNLAGTITADTNVLTTLTGQKSNNKVTIKTLFGGFQADVGSDEDGYFYGEYKLTHTEYTANKSEFIVVVNLPIKSADRKALETVAGKVKDKLDAWATEATYLEHDAADSFDSWEAFIQDALDTEAGAGITVTMNITIEEPDTETGANGSITGKITLSKGESKAKSIEVIVPDGVVILSETTVTLKDAADTLNNATITAIALSDYESGSDNDEKITLIRNKAKALIKEALNGVEGIEVEWVGTPAVTIPDDTTTTTQISGEKVTLTINGMSGTSVEADVPDIDVNNS